MSRGNRERHVPLLPLHMSHQGGLAHDVREDGIEKFAQRKQNANGLANSVWRGSHKEGNLRIVSGKQARARDGVLIQRVMPFRPPHLEWRQPIF